MKSIITTLFILIYLPNNGLFANISAPTEPFSGNIIGNSSMKDIMVLHENLTINLTDIGNVSTAHINAIYKIKCLTPINLLDIVFVATNLKEKNYKISIDNNSIDGKPLKLNNIPKSWLPPEYIKWKNSTIPYQYDSTGLISLKIDSIPIGEHILQVSYDAEVSSCFADDIAQLKTLVYIHCCPIKS